MDLDLVLLGFMSFRGKAVVILIMVLVDGSIKLYCFIR